MAATTPFQIGTGATTGYSTVIVTGTIGATVVASISGTVTGYLPSILCSNWGPNIAYVRLSGEAAPTAAAATDHAMLGNTVRLFANPVPTGTLRIAVLVTVTSSANVFYVTPGQGGI